MEELLTQLNPLIGAYGPRAATLAGLIVVIIQQLKRSSWLDALAQKHPVWEMLAYVLGVAGAYAYPLPNPIIVGIIVGVMANAGYKTGKVKK